MMTVQDDLEEELVRVILYSLFTHQVLGLGF